jgi:hypothetical protein
MDVCKSLDPGSTLKTGDRRNHYHDICPCRILAYPRFPFQAKVRPSSVSADLLLRTSPWSFWLKPRHVDIAVERTQRFRRSDNKKFTLATIKRTVKMPLLYFFITLYPASVLAQAGYQCQLSPGRVITLPDDQTLISF